MAQAVTTQAVPLGRMPAADAACCAASPRETTLVIENMHCGACMSKVERALAGVAGVTSARANLTTKRVLVSHGGAATIPALVGALEGAGFKAAELIADAAKGGDETDRDFLRRLAVAGFAAANIMLLSVSVWSAGEHDMPGSMRTLFHWLSALIALPTVAYAGQPFFRSASAAIRARRLNMDVPISLGVLLATAMSLYQTVRGTEQVYFDAAVSLLFFLLIGRALDSRMRTRAAGAAANLLGLRSGMATVVDAAGVTRRVSTRDLAPGARVLTASGERFAVDGRIVDGDSEIDESLITGETRPRSATVGASVYAGTVNLGQPVTIEAVATGEGTLVAEIARLMSAAEQGRAAYVRLADRAARLYAPVVHILGLGTFLGWLALGYGWEAGLTAAIAVLIITCPCALALAVPAVQVAAVSRLFGRGVLVKAPDALERLAEVDSVVFDKTGTLTVGRPMLAAEPVVADDVLQRAAALAAPSRHPYAVAIVAAARARGLPVNRTEGVAETAGLGMSRKTPDGEERLGSARWCGVAARDGVSVWFSAPGMAAQAFAFEDRSRPDVTEVVTALKGAGLAVSLLSGDRSEEVEKVAKAAHIDDRTGELLPGAKLERIGALAKAGRHVLMVGDGLNDAPALAAGHASMSPSTAADISQTASDIVFQGEALSPVLETLAVAREVRRMSLQNFAIAIGYNIVFVPLAVVGLVTPLIAAVAMSASSIAVTANAVRLRTKRLQLAPAAPRRTPA